MPSNPKYRLYYGDGSHYQDDTGRTEFGQRRAEMIKKRMYPVELEAVRWPPTGPAWVILRVTHEEADAILDKEAAVALAGGTLITPQEIIQVTPEGTGAFEISDSKFADYNGKAHDVTYRTSPGTANVFALTDAELDDLLLAVVKRISEREFYSAAPEDPKADPDKQP